MTRSLYLTMMMGLILVMNSYGQIKKRSIYMTKSKKSGLSRYQGETNTFSKPKRYNSLGLSVSALNYFGDLAPKPNSFSTDISFTKPAIGFSFTHRKGPRFSIRTSFMYGVLRGADSESANPNDISGKYRYVRNLSFRNQIKELSVIAVFDLFKNESNHLRRVDFTPYGFIGIAVFHHNPEAKAPTTDLRGQSLSEGGSWVKLWPLGTEGQFANLDPEDANYGIKPYNRIQVAMPLGIGARVKLNEFLDIEVETGFRYLFTDYIDDVSRNYVNLAKLDSELARAMSYRSNEIVSPVGEQVGAILSKKYIDSSGYEVVAGYGDEHISNVRGNRNDKDIYLATTIRVSYVIARALYRARGR